jgi:hypothetical protein
VGKKKTKTTTTNNHNLKRCLCGSSLGNDLSRLCFHATFGANSPPQICFKHFVNSPLDRIQNLVGFSNNSLGFYLFKQLGLQWCNFCFFITKIKALLAEEFIKQRKVHMRNCKSCIYIITLGF